MLLHTGGIVLKSVKYGETSVITHILTAEKGLHTFIAGGVRKPRSAMPFTLFQPMSHIEIVAYFKESTEKMHRLKEAKAGSVFTKFPFDIKRGAVALFMAELTQKCIHNGEENRELYTFILDYLHWLDTTTHPYANLHLHFMLGLSGHLGFQPWHEPSGQWFDLKSGEYAHELPLHGQALQAEQIQLMVSLLQIPIPEMHTIVATREQRRQLLSKLTQFFQFNVPNFKEINTPGILDMLEL